MAAAGFERRCAGEELFLAVTVQQLYAENDGRSLGQHAGLVERNRSRSGRHFDVGAAFRWNAGASGAFEPRWLTDFANRDRPLRQRPWITWRSFARTFSAASFRRGLSIADIDATGSIAATSALPSPTSCTTTLQGSIVPTLSSS